MLKIGVIAILMSLYFLYIAKSMIREKMLPFGLKGSAETNERQIYLNGWLLVIFAVPAFFIGIFAIVSYYSNEEYIFRYGMTSVLCIFFPILFIYLLAMKSIEFKQKVD